MINGIRNALNSKPLSVIARPILGSLVFGGLLFGPIGAISGALFGLFYQALRTIVVHLSLDEIQEKISNKKNLNETKKSAFNQGVRAADSYLEWAKTFLPGNAAFKEPAYYYAGLGAKIYVCDENLIDVVSKIRTNP